MMKLPVAVVCMLILGIFVPQSFYALKNDDNKISLTNSDQKKIDKAESISKKGDNSSKEADKIYADIVSKHWSYPQVWHLLQPLFFYSGDTANLLDHDAIEEESQQKATSS